MTAWKQQSPPSVDERLAQWTINEPPELHGLRVALRREVQAHADLAGDEFRDLSERLVIVATELAGNALRHTRPPAVVALLRAGARLVIDVVDHDPGSMPVVRHRPDDAGGRGLRLTSQLSTDVGWYPTATGKHVWVAFEALPGWFCRRGPSGGRSLAAHPGRRAPLLSRSGSRRRSGPVSTRR